MAQATNTTEYSATYTGPKTDGIKKMARVLPNGVAQAGFLEGNLYSNITANGTTTLKTGVGTLVAVMINVKGGSANTVTIYDNTAGSGTTIATIDTTASLVYLPYGAAFTTGLTIVMATGTAANITIMYI